MIAKYIGSENGSYFKKNQLYDIKFQTIGDYIEVTSGIHSVIYGSLREFHKNWCGAKDTDDSVEDLIVSLIKDGYQVHFNREFFMNALTIDMFYEIPCASLKHKRHTISLDEIKYSNFNVIYQTLKDLRNIFEKEQLK